jgi:transcriptional regulator with XRE-family HTH domain
MIETGFMIEPMKVGEKMDSQKIGQYIAQRRKELGMTQGQVASKLNISDGVVSKWERGINFPDIAIVEQLSIVLDISVIELLKGEKNQDNAVDPEIKEAVLETLNYSKEVDSRKTKKFVRSTRLWKVMLVMLVFALIFARPVLTFYQNQASAKMYNRISVNIKDDNWYDVIRDADYYLSHYYGASKYNEIHEILPIAQDKFARLNFGDLMKQSGLTNGELDTLFLVMKNIGIDPFGSVMFPKGDINTEREFIVGYLSDQNLGSLIVDYRNRTITRLTIASSIMNGNEPFTYFTLYTDTEGFLMTYDDVKSIIDAYYEKLNNQ